MVATPLLFSTNLVFGRSVVAEVSPFTLAFLRWVAVAAALVPFMVIERAALRQVLRSSARLIFLLAFLGMWICGGIVYLGLQSTSATNGTLILTTSPVIILLLEAAFSGRRIGAREALGAVIAFVGIAVIVLRGAPSAFASLKFNPGDLLLLSGATSWAIYSLLIRRPALRPLSSFALLGLLAGVGAAMLLPFAAFEWATGGRMPVTAQAWSGIGGIVLLASLLAFSGYQFGVQRFGPTVASVFMYLLPAYGVLLAVLLLGERLEAFHFAGIALIVGGVVMATFPAGRLTRGLRRRS